MCHSYISQSKTNPPSQNCIPFYTGIVETLRAGIACLGLVGVEIGVSLFGNSLGVRHVGQVCPVTEFVASDE